MIVNGEKMMEFIVMIKRCIGCIWKVLLRLVDRNLKCERSGFGFVGV